MTKRLDMRASALLCCCAAVLVTACGGSELNVEQPAQLAARTYASTAPQPGATNAATGFATPAAVAADFALLGYAAPPSLAATSINYYVSPGGSDTGSGSMATPFKSLSRAATVVASKAAALRNAGSREGITVWVAPGTYNGGFRTTGSGDASGTASSRIYYVSTTKWGARIVPPANSTNNAAWDNRGNYASIIGFEVDGSKIGTGTKWIYSLYSGGSYTRFEGNKVHHVATTVPCNGTGGSAIGIDSYYKGVKGEVIGNVVHDVGPAGCRFVHGIYISTSAVVKNNVVYRVAAGAIHLWHDANDVVISNNTVSSSNSGIIVGGGDYYWRTIGADNVRVHSNIVYDNVQGIFEPGRTGCNNVYSHNLVFKNGTNWSLKPCVRHTNSVTADPLFVGYSRTAASPDFHLTPSSPAIGRATAVHAHPFDFDGRARNASTGYDIGAYQLIK